VLSPCALLDCIIIQDAICVWWQCNQCFIGYIYNREFWFGRWPIVDLMKWDVYMSVCPPVHTYLYVHTYVLTSVRPQKLFSYFDIIWCVGRPRPGMRTHQYDLDPIQGQGQGHGASHLSRSISSVILASSSRLIVGGDSMGPGRSTACLSPVFEFPSRKAIKRVETLRNVDISRNSNGHISVVREATVRWLGTLIVLHVLCILLWPWPDPSSRSWGF